jgi:hypothetical protein
LVRLLSAVQLAALAAVLIGAPAFAQTPVYYSVGTSAADLKSSPAVLVTFAGGTATFTEAQPDNVGVGDEITYNTSNKAFISGRTSSTVFTVTTRVGTVPGNVANATVNSIRRAFNSLTTAEANSSDGNHLGVIDLVAGGFQLHLACYNDGPMADSDIFIDGWTTGPNHYIRIFTPVSTSEVGRSQRHRGVAGTGFRLARVADLTAILTFYYLRVFEEYVRIEGIELDGSGLTNGRRLNVVRTESTLSPTSDVRFDQLLIHDFVNSAIDPGTDTDVFAFQIQNGSVKISNTIIYRFDQLNTNVSSGTDAIRFSGTHVGTSFVHNNTLYDIKNSVLNTNNANGISVGSGTVTVRNNAVFDVLSPSGLGRCFEGPMTESNNVSSDATAGGASSQTNQTSYATYFRSITPGGRDLHLRRDSKTLWGSDGADLDTDPNLPVTKDVDNQPRSATAPDIGADEASVVVSYSVGTSVANLRSSGALTVNVAAGTATFSEAQSDNLGVGDEVVYGANTAYIASRTSSTVYTLRTAKGLDPPNAAGASVSFIRRAFNSLTLAQTGSFDVSHLGTQDLVAENFQLQWACYKDAPMNDRLDLAGWTTGPENFIRIFAPASVPTEVGASQRHLGRAATGFRLAPVDATVANFNIVVLRTGYIRIEGLEIDGSGLTNARLVRGLNVLAGLPNVGDIRIDSNVIHDLHTTQTGSNFDGSFGIYAFQQVANAGPPLLVTNNVIYDVTASIPEDNHHIGGIHIGSRTTSYVYNNTILGIRNTGAPPGGATWGIEVSSWPPATGTATVLARNNYAGDVLSTNDVEACYEQNNGGVLTQGFNVSSDGTAVGATGQASYATYFSNVTNGLEDLHLTADSNALWGLYGDDLSAVFTGDVDGGLRQAPWDVGADDTQATTAVELLRFFAEPLDESVLLTWETGSETKNLGFHLYRASGERGKYERITASPIPGLGSSPEGARYQYRDTGLRNGVTYFYELEDIDTRGRTKLHGPVAGTPAEGSVVEGARAIARITVGNPTANELRIVERARDGILLELVTNGFYAEPLPDGTVALAIPGFDALNEDGPRALPVKRTWIEARIGRKVKLVSVEARDLEVFDGLSPWISTDARLEALRDGTVRATRKRSVSRDSNEAESARLVEVGFQGERKKALVELSPFRWDESRGSLVLARRLLVRVDFRERDLTEVETSPGRGRRFREKPSQASRGVWRRLRTREQGLHVVSFEDLFGARARPVAVASLLLSRGSEIVPFHVEPASDRFGPGSLLYFVSAGPRANPYDDEAVYELELGVPGNRMPVAEISSFETYGYELEREENHYYQAALTKAPDLWLWEVLLAPARKTFSFEAVGLVPNSGVAALEVFLQGTSDFEEDPDHHVRAFLNGVLVAETRWDGRDAHTLRVELAPGILREGSNELELENVGDTGALYSMVMLDRFRVRYARRLDPPAGERLFVLDESGESPIWLRTRPEGEGTRPAVEARRRFRIVTESRLLRPEVLAVPSARLKREGKRADYVLIGPAALLSAAAPLAELRRSQGLAVELVTTEDIYSEFGFGERSPEAIREFLVYAYHTWRRPSFRYVLLLGDASYDFKDYLGTGVANQVPPLMVPTSYLWTASDPTFAAVNGEDSLPDVAIGRLPAANVEQARRMVAKILEYESNGLPGEPRVVLVADDADAAGDFQADAEEISARFFSNVELRKIYLAELGAAAARNQIAGALDDGATLWSYLGHGGIHVWAGENVLDVPAVESLSPQPVQPVLLTMNCLNGYFHFPYFDSLAEALVKAEGRGAIAAFSPSGLSLNGPAHVYHQKLLEALVQGGHERLGDAVLEAQTRYADTGAFPELLAIYHLLGDPALRLR